jgi:hypothetical protein
MKTCYTLVGNKYRGDEVTFHVFLVEPMPNIYNASHSFLGSLFPMSFHQRFEAAVINA